MTAIDRTPSTPAAGGTVDVRGGVEAAVLPPRPGIAVLVWSALCGATVAAMSSIATVAALVPLGWVLPNRSDVYAVVIVILLAGTVLVLAASSWWRALRNRDGDRIEAPGMRGQRWAALLLPFFVVIGGAAGLAFTSRLEADRPYAPDPLRSHSVCERVLHFSSDTHPAFLGCLPVSTRCQEQILATTNRIEDVDDCVELAGKAPNRP